MHGEGELPRAPAAFFPPAPIQAQLDAKGMVQAWTNLSASRGCKRSPGRGWVTHEHLGSPAPGQRCFVHHTAVAKRGFWGASIL